MANGLQIKRTRSHHLAGWLIPAVLMVLAAISGWFFYRWYTTGEDLPLPIPVAKADSSVDESDVTPTQVDEYTVPAGDPRYLSIPSLGIGNTRIFPLEVTANNQLEAPDNINDLGWYNKSSQPGNGGAVLIDGHNGGIRKDGVFAKLGTLQPGDTIDVERGDGQKFTYKVVENQSMSLEDVNAKGMAMMMKSAQPGVEGLNLITCDGKWVPALKEFDRRIMLRAVLVSE